LIGAFVVEEDDAVWVVVFVVVEMLV